jgi:excisionase family DNA binding protein
MDSRISNPYEEMITRLQVMSNQLARLTEEVTQMKEEQRLPANRITFTLEEAAEALGVSYHTIDNMVKDGRLECCQPGGKKGKRLVERHELIRAIRSSREVKLKVAR